MPRRMKRTHELATEEAINKFFLKKIYERGTREKIEIANPPLVGRAWQEI